MEIFYLKKGDTFPRIEAILSDAQGAIDLTGCTVLFRCSIAGGGNDLLEEPAVILDQSINANKGHVYYEWQDGDTDEVGTHNCEWRVTFPNGKKATFPRGSGDSFNRVIIQDEVV